MAITPNHLLELLPRRDRYRLLDMCEPVKLELEETLCEPGEPMRYVYFPTEGSISLVALIDGRPHVAIGMAGCESMVGAEFTLGVGSAQLRALVRHQGTAWRIGQRAFRKELASSASLQRSVDRFLYVQMGQLIAAIGCVRFHQIGPRLARWLLLSQDHDQADTFRATHEVLAYMLGVRRSGVTEAANALQDRGLIRYARGNLTVLDRSSLEAGACSCYASARRAYAALLS